MKLPTLSFDREAFSSLDYSLQKEWLVTNGLGGYASSTILGINTRKYHGLLVAALHPPGDRTVCLSKLDEEVSVGSEAYSLGANEFIGAIYPKGFQFLKQFSISPFPKFVYGFRGVEVEKTLFMPSEKNAVIAIYRVVNTSDSDVNVKVTPLISCRHFHSVVDRWKTPLSFSQQPNGIGEVQLTFTAPSATITVRSTEGLFRAQPNWIEQVLYREERMRGESSIDDCYQPGYFEIPVSAKTEDKFVVSAIADESGMQNSQVLDEISGITSDAERLLNRELYLRSIALTSFYSSKSTIPAFDWLRWILMAASSFTVRSEKNKKSIIAGYHWFENWGRDTFISLPGLMLVTGRFDDAKNVLGSFSSHIRGGLIPNFLDDKSGQASYNTVDATLWFINAVLQYVKYTGDFTFVRNELWEKLQDIADSHVKGTDFGIHMDNDGLLAHGSRLTWMDAEIEGNPVTPREDKAVEIQSLWYNALRALQLFAAKFEEGNLEDNYAALADKVQNSFQEKFWNNELNYLLDSIGEAGSDASLRPNQIIAAALDFSILNRDRSTKIIDAVERELLTPFGLRTLERNDPRYKGIYAGDRQSRDQAYHNGTIWPWLLGPFTTAFLKVKGNNRRNAPYAFDSYASKLFTEQISEGGLGTVNEIFDGEFPHTPRGCISQAWSVAEPLRAYVEDTLQVRPRYEKVVLKT